MQTLRMLRSYWWAALLALLGLEGLAAYAIRDNLTLNTLNFIHQFDFIKNWQQGT